MVNCSVRETASRANGLHEVFLKGNTVLGLKMAADVMSALETLNTSLQSKRQTISGMMLAVEHVKRHLENRRTEEHFEGLYVQAQDIASSLDLVPIKMPHIRCPPKRLSGPAEPHIHPSAESFYRSHYFNMLDTAARQLTQRFDEPGIHTLGRLEKVLISGEMDDIIKSYPELDQVALKVQLSMLKSTYQYSNCGDVVDLLKTMVPEVRSLFKQVETLLRLLLVVPASSSQAERSFSALRRLKTWLRTNMTQRG
ncbi:uncharacterized protein LOC120548945 [Perca fluviatilis]|uniref:uncharacterized protein LOC120548945 n=1 Tax=Perca fluviatilis TaxID=8168 RepID=UPI0019639C0F|nr:uncharacterized protein LOC120548945 [Perca fluviatilis]